MCVADRISNLALVIRQGCRFLIVRFSEGMPPGWKYAHVEPHVTTVTLAYGGARGIRKLVPSAG